MGVFDDILADLDMDPALDDLVGQDDDAMMPVPKGRARRAYQFLIDKGLSPAGAAGMVGNLMQESGQGLDPSLIHDGGIGVGISGWNGPRRLALQAMAKARGVGETDFDTQLEHIWQELNGSEKATLSMLQGASDPATAAKIAVGYFRPSNPMTTNRIANAIKMYSGADPSSSAAIAAAQPQAIGQLQKQRPKSWPSQYHLPNEGEEYNPEDEPGANNSAFLPLAQFAEEALGSLSRSPEEVAALNQPYIPQMPVDIAPIDDATREAQNVEGANTSRQIASEVTSRLANTPWNILAMMQSPYYAITGKVNPVLNTIERNKETAQSFFAAKGTGPEAQIAGGIAESLTPSLPLTAALGGMNVVSDMLVPSANAANEKGPSKKTLKQQETDRILGERLQFIREGLPFNPNLTQFTPDERPVISIERNRIAYGEGNGRFEIIDKDGRSYVVPSSDDGSVVGTMEVVNKNGGLDKFPSYGSRALAENARMRMTSLIAPEMERRKMIVQTAGGPMAIDPTTAMVYGGAAAIATMGMVFAPTVFRKFLSQPIPLARSIEFTHPDVGAISKPGDFVRSSVDDVNKGLVNVAQRSGLSPDDVTHIRRKLDIETRGAAQTLADSAVVNGEMKSLDYDFKVRVPMAQLNKADDAQFSQYIHARNILEQFNEMQTKNMMNPRTKPAPTTIRGYTEQDALSLINDMERVNPQLRQKADAYTENVRATNRFLSTGEFATMTVPERTIKNATRPSYVPGMDKQLDAPVPVASATKEYGNHMSGVIRMRLENEAKGQYIDAVKDIDVGGGKRLFVQLSPDEIRNNPKWAKNTVTIYRRGKREVYATEPFIADLMRMDPYYVTGQMRNMVALKNVFQSTTTGALAPWFAATSFFRNQKLVRVSADANMKTPWIGRSVMAIPEQMLPQLAKSVGESLDNGSGGWLRTMLGDNYVDGLSKQLIQRYRKSFYAHMEASGTHYGSVLEQQIYGNKNLNAALQNIDPTYAQAAKSIASNLWRGYNASLQAVHNAPAFAFAKKNRNLVNMDPAELAYEARRVTGNPMAGGQRYTDRGAIRFDAGDDASRYTRAKVRGARTIGDAAEFGRNTIPWFNTTLQGNRRLVQAYLKNPAKFTGRVWLYSQLPAAASYLLAYGADKDPNGRSYADYMVSGRSDWDRMMYTYIAIPGLPAEKGIRIPNVHELSMAGVLMQDAIHHSMASNMFSAREDAQRAAYNFLGITSPGLPAIGSATMGAFGMRPPMGVFGGEAFTPRTEPYNQFSLQENIPHLPSNVEAFTRAAAPGISDVFWNGLTAAVSSEDAIKGAGNFFKAAGRRMVEKTPVVREVVGMPLPMAGNIPIMDEFYAQKKQIDDLLMRFARYEKEAADHGPGEFSLKGASKSGTELQSNFMRPQTVVNRAGITQPEPTNPIYNAFIAELYDTFKHDDVSTGGMGFATAMKGLKVATDQMRSLRNVNEGNYQVWQRQLDDKPDVVEELKRFGVNSKRRNDVMTFFAQQQQDYARHLLFMIKTVENSLSKKAQAQGLLAPGQTVKFKDLAPFDQGFDPTLEE